MTELSCQVEEKKQKTTTTNQIKLLSSAWTGLPCPSSSDADILSEARRCGTLTEPRSPSRYQPLCCLRPYASAVPVSGIPLTTTAAACLQNFRLLWYIPAYVCMLFSPIDNTWARSLFLFFSPSFLFFFFPNEGEMLPYARKNKRRPKLTAPSAKHTWRQESGPCSTLCPTLRRMPHCHQC